MSKLTIDEIAANHERCAAILRELAIDPDGLIATGCDAWGGVTIHLYCEEWLRIRSILRGTIQQLTEDSFHFYFVARGVTWKVIADMDREADWTIRKMATSEQKPESSPCSAK